MSHPAILFEDDLTLVVNKPHGLLVHNSAWAGSREETLMQLLPRGVHLIHRLDRATSGVLLLAKTPDAARAWQHALQQHATRKLYVALVRGHMQAAVDLEHPIKDEHGTARDARSIMTPLAQSSVERCSIVQVELRTGRHHQARRHLRHVGHPVVGDTTWGSGQINRHYRAGYALHRLCLHAFRLHINHPGTGARVAFTAPLPDDLALPFEQLVPGFTLPGQDATGSVDPSP